MRILYGTTNPAKIKHMNEILNGLDIEIIGLKDLNVTFDDVEESGNNPMENARIKALAYYKAAGMPVFSCDTGLYIEGLENKEQPGAYVRRMNGRTMNDEEMIEYYTSLAAKAGGTVQARYINAICLVTDERNVFEYDGEDICSIPFLICDKAHQHRIPGYPLDSVSQELKTGKYYFDLDGGYEFIQESDMKNGYRRFFIKNVL